MTLTSYPIEKKTIATQLPKAEVHVHLEGCFDPEQLAVWAKESGILLPRPKEELLNFKGLTDFLEFLDWSSSLVSTRERLAQLSYSYAERLSRNGGIYADLIFNPTHWKAWHGKLDGMIDAIDSGLREAEQDGLASVGLCVSLLRQQSASEAIELVEFLTTLKHPRVVALSVDGNEAAAGRTGNRFAEAFSRAGNAGLKRTVHAGESSGPQGVSDAILLLGADRIDHGVRAIEDPEVVDLLVDKNIPIGVCPTSNIKLGVYESFEKHPLNRLLESGVKVTINTDDPVLLNTTLMDEYLICQNTFGWSNNTLYQVAKNSIDASFAAPEEKIKFQKALSNWESQYCIR
ncbi:adenosine deaminase [Klebsiella sp. BIGb0407]|uniref:adenosine deaminase n=1 Tax=Klebsiella sp. BIGb0407 TaxID=2940603 RepID=UPI0021691927|nr:adenosine deaminase [Klebsiella sp. BIGb0407]MCS3432178.1 adenosine deaminase [Klebsiella sp. BIGb0407]